MRVFQKFLCRRIIFTRKPHAISNAGCDAPCHATETGDEIGRFFEQLDTASESLKFLIRYVLLCGLDVQGSMIQLALQPPKCILTYHDHP